MYDQCQQQQQRSTLAISYSCSLAGYLISKNYSNLGYETIMPNTPDQSLILSIIE